MFKRFAVSCIRDSLVMGVCSVLPLLALTGCSGAGGGSDGAPGYGGLAPFANGTGTSSPSSSSSSGGTQNSAATNGSGGTSTGSSASETAQTNGVPIAPAAASGTSGGNASNAGAANVAATNGSATGGNTGMGAAGSSGMMASNAPSMNGQAGSGSGSDPNTPGSGGSMSMMPPAASPPLVPPGDAFFFDDFEASTVGKAPPNWHYFVAWVQDQANPSGNASALVDDARAHSGSHSIHFMGGQNPAQITFPLPAGTTRLYIRAYVYMTRQFGQDTDPNENHETLIGVRGAPGSANNEIRFGEIKGVIGTNEVPSDNISPKMDQWGKGPVVTANDWHCIEVQFLGDQPQNELFAYADGTLVHSITAPDQWQNGMLPANWMNGKFKEAILGWHSFSNINTDVWMDDIVLSTSPIGCD